MICLVVPPSPFLLDERVFMSLGVLKVAAALEHAKVPVEVLDLSGVSNYLDAVRDHALRSPQELCYGITATSPQLPAAVQIADTIHRAVDRRIILGGPHATLVNAAFKRETKRGTPGRAARAMQSLANCFDVIVAGDGERAILDAIKGPRGFFFIIDADDRHSPYWMDDSDLDASPFPARHLVDVESYRYAVDGVPALSLIAQLGCPFGCGFCAGRHSPMLRHIRTRSAVSVVREMEDMFETWGTRGFMFYDDELNVSRGMIALMHEIAEFQRRRGVEFRLRGFVKAELFTDAQAAAMLAAGFSWILVGFESGSERILENINKRATKADNTRCIEIARRHGLKVKALMSLGHPGESRETATDTLRWLAEVRPDDFDLTIITPYPGSPYYDDAIASNAITWTYTTRNGDRLHQFEVDYTQRADYYKGAPGAYVSHVWTDHLDPVELVAIRDHVEQEIRAQLGIPFNPAAPALAYEHSMGMTALPRHILRASA